MKNFFTSMLGALVALVIFSGGCLLLFIGFLAAMAVLGRSEKSGPNLERGSYVVFDLSTNISDAPPPVDLSIFGGKPDTLQLRTVTRALRAAAKDERVAGIFITGDLTPAAFGSGYAALKEVRGALEDFRASGKPIAGYLTYATTKTYYLASAATDLAIDPYGNVYTSDCHTKPAYQLIRGAYYPSSANRMTGWVMGRSYCSIYTVRRGSPASCITRQRIFRKSFTTISSSAIRSRAESIVTRWK